MLHTFRKYHLFAVDAYMAKGIGGTGFEVGMDIKVDQNGNVYTTGTFTGTCDFDPGVGVSNLTSAGDDDIFVCKLDSNGGFIWAKSFGGSDEDQPRSIAVDASGNVYLTGYFNDYADFDPGAGTLTFNCDGTRDVFVVKLNASGNLTWARQIGGSDSECGNSVAVDLSGNVYTTGYFNGTPDFDPGGGSYEYISAGFTDVFILKLNSSGNFVWVKRFGWTSYEEGLDVKIDPSGNVYTVGYFNDAVDFNPNVGVNGLTSAGSSDIFVSKLDASGNYVWAKRMGGTSSEIGRSIEIDASNNVITTGYFFGTGDYNPGTAAVNLISSGSRDVFISKLNSSGNYVWAKKIGGTGDDRGSSIVSDISGNIYLTGIYSGTVDFDPDTGVFNQTASTTASYILKLDPTGNFSGARKYSTANEGGIDCNNNGSVYWESTFGSTIDMDPGAGVFNLTSAGSGDVCVVKLFQCSNSHFTLNPTVCDSYVSPSGNYTWSTSGIYFDTIPNPLGCDSIHRIATINLIVNYNSSPNVLNMIACDSYTINSQTYTMTGIYNPVLLNSSGCDSNLVLNLTIKNSSSSSITTTECNIYTLNSQTYTSSGNYTQNFTNAVGCDSIVYLYLTIDGAASVIQSGTTLTSTLADTYQWIDCSNGNSIIPGANNQTYIPTASGSYAVIVTENACIDTSNCSVFISIGIEENSLSGISVFPNPTNGNINLDPGENSGTFLVEIFNVVGQKTESIVISSDGSTNLSIPGASGIYFVRISQNGLYKTVRIVKQ